MPRHPTPPANGTDRRKRRHKARDKGQRKSTDSEQASAIPHARSPLARVENAPYGAHAGAPEHWRPRHRSNRRSPRPGAPNERVAVWNHVKGYKRTGNNAPFRRNLAEYLASHPGEVEPYAGQENDDARPENWRMETDTRRRVRLVNGRLCMIDTGSGRVMSGNCCPLYSNTDEFLRNNTHLERLRDDDADLETQELAVREADAVHGAQSHFTVYGNGVHDNLLEVPLLAGAARVFSTKESRMVGLVENDSEIVPNT